MSQPEPRLPDEEPGAAGGGAPPHALAPDAVAVAFAVDPARGLDEAEILRRRARHGENAVRHRKSTGLWRILASQFESAVVLLLAVAGLVAMATGHWTEAAAIAVVLAINTAIGFFTEFRALRSMEALRMLGTPVTRVRRAGQARMVPSAELVPGDIVLVEGGDVVTADLRLVEASNMAVDESALTGESVPVEKSVDPVPAAAPLPDRACLVFKGTSVARGSGTGIVVATGMDSELGRISRLVEEAEPETTPIERQLTRLGGQLVRLTLLIVALIGAVGIFAGRDPFLMIEAAIALAVAAIPEGLPVVATLALARGMWRMARANALVERLSAVETLGATTIILTDKTGTLTQNRMVVRDVWTPSGRFSFEGPAGGAPQDEIRDEVFRAILLCNDAELGEGGGGDIGDPLELALLRAGREAGYDRKGLLAAAPRLRTEAFSAETRLMATVHEAGGGAVAFVKGAPEAVLAGSARIAGGEGERPLGEADRRHWEEATDTLAGHGLRVLAVAARALDDPGGPATEGLTFLGLVAMYDPPRPEVPEAIRNCREAGIRVVMMTGDHERTARNIAASIGLVTGEPRVMEGEELRPLAELSPAEIEAVRGVDVFARVDPRQKLDLVAIHQRAGEIVAMTGDGVNDAPALKKADIGVAMGLRGTQVAREAAAMVLRDDAFGTIVKAVREGRVIFRNIQTFVMYLLSCNLSEVLVVGVAILAGLPLPLLPLQILFLNLVTDVFPAFALGAGEGEARVLRRRPRDPSKPILSRELWRAIVAHALAITAATLGALVLARHGLGLDGDAVLTVSFLTLALAQLWHVFNMRDPHAGIFANAVTRNPLVWGALALCLVLILMAVYLPAAATVLELVPLAAEGWLLVLAMSALPLLAGQLGAVVVARRGGGRDT